MEGNGAPGSGGRRRRLHQRSASLGEDGSRLMPRRSFPDPMVRIDEKVLPVSTGQTGTFSTSLNYSSDEENTERGRAQTPVQFVEEVHRRLSGQQGDRDKQGIKEGNSLGLRTLVSQVTTDKEMWLSIKGLFARFVVGNPIESGVAEDQFRRTQSTSYLPYLYMPEEEDPNNLIDANDLRKDGPLFWCYEQYDIPRTRIYKDYSIFGYQIRDNTDPFHSQKRNDSGASVTHPHLNVAVCNADDYGRYIKPFSHFKESIQLSELREGRSRWQTVFIFGSPLQSLNCMDRYGLNAANAPIATYGISNKGKLLEDASANDGGGLTDDLRAIASEVISTFKLSLPMIDFSVHLPQTNAFLRQLTDQLECVEDQRDKDYLTRFFTALTALQQCQDPANRVILSLVCMFYASGLKKEIEVDTHLIAPAPSSVAAYARYRKTVLGFERAIALFSQVRIAASGAIHGFHDAINQQLSERGAAEAGPCIDDLRKPDMPSHALTRWIMRFVFTAILLATIGASFASIGIPAIAAVVAGFTAFYCLIEMCVDKYWISSDASNGDMPQCGDMHAYLSKTRSTQESYVNHVYPGRAGALWRYAAEPYKTASESASLTPIDIPAACTPTSKRGSSESINALAEFCVY